MLNGTVYSSQLEGWTISWESNSNYRHWCYQEHPLNEKIILVVMFNPGKLSGDGINLTGDTTLRILRRVFENTGFNPFIVNLFDLATPKPDELFIKWKDRDNELLVYDKIKDYEFSGIIYAYGDYQNNREYGNEIIKRIDFIRNKFLYLAEIELPRNNSGTPTHPFRWLYGNLEFEVKYLIKNFAEKQNLNKLDRE